MTTYQEIISDAAEILQDEDSSARRWPDSSLLKWAKRGEREIVRLKPDSNPVISVHLLASGARQTLPGAAIQLLDVLCNMGTTGNTRGDLVTLVDAKVMNTLNPGWMAATPASTVTHVIYDPKRAPKLFWVYPPSPGTNYLEIVTAQLPDNASRQAGDSLVLGDEVAQALLHFVVAMAYAKDMDIPQSHELMASHYALFRQMLMGRDMLEEAINPKRTRVIP